jgi:alkylation response protein AidB-like acyl-CoA dehydrogenase
MECVLKEYSELVLPDQRLTKRVKKFLEAAWNSPAASLPKMFEDAVSLEGAYRLMSNERVSFDALHQPHRERTACRAQDQGTVVVVHDTTDVETAYASPEEVGYLNTGRTGYRAHVSLAISVEHFHCVLVNTGDGPGAMGLSFLLVPSNVPGLHVEATIPLLAPRAFAGLRFDGCALPEGALIGKSGRGFGYAMEILDFYRVSVGAAAIGFCRSAQRASIGWARNRQLFGTSLLELQLTKSKLSDMATYLDAASLLVARAAWELDQGIKRIAKHTSMAKLFATEGAQKVVDDTVQLFGAEGLVSGSVPERLYRQILSLRIYEGTSEIQKLLIAKASASECAATDY